VVIADEPTGNLDSRGAQEFMVLLHHLQQRLGVTIIIATHDEVVDSHTQRRIRLRDGAVVCDTKNSFSCSGVTIIGIRLRREADRSSSQGGRPYN
jgi:ABC-type lipoprotein export system ATPase subunit